jgi:hypothetical protein
VRNFGQQQPGGFKPLDSGQAGALNRVHAGLPATFNRHSDVWETVNDIRWLGGVDKDAMAGQM